MCGGTALTQRGEPAGDGAVDLVQDDDDDEVDDGGGGLDCGSDVGARCGVGAHVQCRFDTDPVQDDPEDYGKGHSDLEQEQEQEEENQHHGF